MPPGDPRDGDKARGLAYAMDERLAPHYERHLVDDCGYRTPDVVAGMLVELGAKGRWLDLGAGTGLVGKATGRTGLAIELVAIDASDAMLNLIEARGYVARHRADATLELPFNDASFDGVVAAGLFEHVADPITVFRHAARVVKPGGAFAFTFPPNGAGRTEPFDADEGLFSHDPDAIRAELASVGFAVTRETSFPAYRSGSHGWVTHYVVAGLRSGSARRIC
jgi:predicted TPR repeat methyltransferase